MKRIIVIIDYFTDQWPDWFDIFIESCMNNPTINWLIHTDCPFVKPHGDNIRFSYMSRSDYCAYVSKKLGISFRPRDRYKLIDLKPAYGFLWAKDIKGFDFWAYGDIDVIYGNLRYFLNDNLLCNDIISTHDWCLSGHFCLFRNSRRINTRFRNIKEWKTLMQNPHPQRLDEDRFLTAFRSQKLSEKIVHLFFPLWQKKIKILLQECWTTPLTPVKWRNKSNEHPENWYYKEGQITNDKDDDISFIYLHFMNFKAPVYLNSKYKGIAPWQKLAKINKVPYRSLRNGVKISFDGIEML